MGQYQQWLYYRDIDRLFHTQLEELEEELAQLHIREQHLQHLLQPVTENATPLLQSDNEILRALAIGLNGHTENIGTDYDYLSPGQGVSPAEGASSRRDPLTNTHCSQNGKPIATISSAPVAQNGLPPTNEQYVTNPVADPDSLQPPIPLSPQNPHYEPALLPEDMDAFIDGHSETEPRMELPVWLRNAALHNAHGPIDQESMRTNRLIQRWIERWGHQRQQEEQQEAQEPREEDISQ